MTTIKASCPSCGDVELTPPLVRLVVCTVPDWSCYSFTCTGCGEEVRKPAGSEVVRLLTAGGVVAESWQVPAEALEPHDGPPVGWDDVLDFALWLEDAALPVAAAGATLRRPRPVR